MRMTTAVDIGGAGERAWLAVGLATLGLAILAFMERPVFGAAVLVLPLAPLAVLQPRWAFLAVVLALAFDDISGIGEVGSATTLTRLLGVGAIGAWFLHVIDRRQPLRLGKPGAWLAAYVAFAVASIAWAPDPVETRQALQTLVQLFLLYLMTVHLCASPRTLGLAADVLLAGAVVVAVLVLGKLPVGDAGRATLQFGESLVNQNYVAAGLVFPAVIAAARGTRTSPAGLLRLAAIVPIAIAIFATGSRGGGVALLCGLAAIALQRGRAAVQLAVAGAAVIAIATAVLPSQYADRMWQRWQHSDEDRLSGRLDIWKVGAAMATDNPVLGVGYAGFRDDFYAYMRETDVDPRWALLNDRGERVAHNVYLAAAAELGAVGIALLVGGLVAHARALRAAARRRPHDPLLLGLGAALVSLVICGATVDLLGTKVAWLVLGMASGAARGNA